MPSPNVRLFWKISPPNKGVHYFLIQPHNLSGHGRHVADLLSECNTVFSAAFSAFSFSCAKEFQAIPHFLSYQIWCIWFYVGSSIYLELSFVHSAKYGSSWNLLHAATASLTSSIYWTCFFFFPQCVFLSFSSKIRCSYACRFMSGFSTWSHWLTHLFHFHTVLATIAL